ncbi:MAG TPA: formimidoylglutamate deiminase [Longimicrobiales bacterium]|nr:formimidoylglutamate deiminase [Longimicrobiales bacterium]
MTRYVAPLALLPDGWQADVVLAVGADGLLGPGTGEAGSDPALPRLPGPVVPGVVNAHSHAFQRALAGGAEVRSGTGDSFWSWREQMYRFLDRLTPEQVQAVATQLYVELLEQGYTRVVEFHYLHHAPDGRPHDDPLEMSRRIVAAARTAGIGLTLLPVLYQTGDFGGTAPTPGQRRFLHDTDAFLDLLRALAAEQGPGFVPGYAFHSLRAVPPAALGRVLAEAPEGGPIHVHAAEQRREVRDSLAWSGLRPVEWLLEHGGLDPRWSLVHCTHVNQEETEALAASGATAVVCPTTEANLGDGFFPLVEWLDAGGSLAVGSDSHVSTSPAEELRWLEYGQRLLTGGRALAATEGLPSTGRRLLEAVWAGGGRAAGTGAGALSPGCPADWVVLEPDHPVLVGRTGDGLLDAWIFSGNEAPVGEVWVGGRRVVAGGVHPRRAEARQAFGEVMRALLRG